MDDEIRKENTLNIILRALFTISGIFLLGGSVLYAGNKLPDAVGNVAASLLNSSIAETAGPEMPAKVARGWTNAVLSKNKQMPEDTVPKFQFKEKGRYDAVAFEFNVSGQTIVTKQTGYIMVVSFTGLGIAGKTDSQLAEMMDNTASVYLADFEHRHFISAGEFDGVKVFNLVVDEGYKTRDWRDNIVGTSTNGTISFSFPKKKAGGAAVITEDPESNKNWFEIVTKDRKRTRSQKQPR